jgi:hypothetical protein
MQKFAQKRSILNKLREKTNLGGIAAEKFFNPEFERVMESLRQADNKIRAIASGSDIEGEDAGPDPVSLKDLLKSAKSNINRREYMTALAFLGRFSKKMESISKFIEELKFNVDKVHHDFLFKDLDTEQQQYLQEMKSRFASFNTQLVAEAGIMDFFHNVTSDRGKALHAWEKRYPQKVKQLKKDIGNLYSKSEGMFGQLLSSLKAMATARATRKVDDYMDSANKVISNFNKYNQQFKEYYGGSFKDFLNKQEFKSPTKEMDEAKKLNDKDIDVEVGPSIPVSKPLTVEDLYDSSSSGPVLPLVQKQAPITPPPPAQANPPVVDNFTDTERPTLPSIDLSGPTTQRSPKTELPSVQENELEAAPDTVKEPEMAPPSKAAHKKFLDSLVAMGDENPEFLAAHISSYARRIEASDPDTAIQLFKVVHAIKQGFGTWDLESTE